MQHSTPTNRTARQQPRGIWPLHLPSRSWATGCHLSHLTRFVRSPTCDGRGDGARDTHRRRRHRPVRTGDTRQAHFMHTPKEHTRRLVERVHSRVRAVLPVPARSCGRRSAQRCSLEPLERSVGRWSRRGLTGARHGGCVHLLGPPPQSVSGSSASIPRLQARCISALSVHEHAPSRCDLLSAGAVHSALARDACRARTPSAASMPQQKKSKKQSAHHDHEHAKKGGDTCCSHGDGHAHGHSHEHGADHHHGHSHGGPSVRVAASAPSPAPSARPSFRSVSSAAFGRALVASRDIPEGELIVRESPLVLLHFASNRPRVRVCAHCARYDTLAQPCCVQEDPSVR